MSEILATIQASVYERALNFREANTYYPADYTELVDALSKGWAYAYWCGDPACEAQVKEDTKATTRCIPLDQEDSEHACIVCGKNADKRVYFARAY
ncbi:MAG: hypothetical protein P8Z00_14935 [Anaerolineales bacterium]